MEGERPVYYQNVATLVDQIIEKVGKDIVFGMPLGLGKPNHIINELYNRAKDDPTIRLNIITALSLEKPTWSSDLERRFLEPFVERVFGGYPDLEYVKDVRAGTMPDNISLMEFYFKPGGFLNVPPAQQNYISSNYTHVVRDTMDKGVNVASQIVRPGEIKGKKVYSMSCNPEIAFDLVPLMREQEKKGQKIAIIGEVNTHLPFMYGDAVVQPEDFDMILDAPEYDFRLFGPPKMAVTTPDHCIGLNVSTLVKDGGTLQIGIGSLGDALVYGLILRHKHNAEYKKIVHECGIMNKFGDLIQRVGGVDAFEEGLLGSTEMLVDGYIHLIREGVVKRKTYNDVHIQTLVNEGTIKNEKVTPAVLEALVERGAIHKKLLVREVEHLKDYGIFKPEVEIKKGVITVDGKEIEADLSDSGNFDKIAKLCLGKKLKKDIIVHGGFFLGPESFYNDLNEMTEEERQRIFMTSVLKVNQLYGNEELKILQRKNGRFCNAGLMVTLNGAVVSDGLEQGQVVSGVGGQYNFVSMAHALPDARSILMIRAIRTKGKDVKSNVVPKYGHLTIPRHLRDIIVTEYGIADLRGKTDWEVHTALINIADSRFQEELLREAKTAGKVPEKYEIPDQFRNNFPERLEDGLKPFKSEGLFPPFPFGTDFTKDELTIGKALKALKEKMSATKFPVPSLTEARKLISVPDQARPYLERLGLDKPETAKEKMLQRMVVYALASQGVV